MRDDLDLTALRQRIEEELSQLENQLATRQDAEQTVELDQTRTGRLTRMDALQSQAMAKAGTTRAKQRIGLLRAALRCLDDGDYGYCLDCEEDISPGRLQADPATPLCIECASAREQH